MHLTWILPTLLGFTSFACEDSGNDGFHLAKSGFRCQYRHGSLVVESLLLHVPMCLCMATMCLLIRSSVHVCLSTVLLQLKTRSLVNIWKVLTSRPAMYRLFLIGLLSFTLMLVWVVQTVLAGVLSRDFVDAVDAWLACIRFDFARRHAAGGEQWEELLVANSEGRLCPASPQGTTLFESQVLRSLFEVLVPAMVAFTFSCRVVKGWVAPCWNMRRTTSMTQVVVGTKKPGALAHHGPNSGRLKANRLRLRLKTHTHTHQASARDVCLSVSLFLCLSVLSFSLSLSLSSFLSLSPFLSFSLFFSPFLSLLFSLFFSLFLSLSLSYSLLFCFEMCLCLILLVRGFVMSTLLQYVRSWVPCIPLSILCVSCSSFLFFYSSFVCVLSFSMALLYVSITSLSLSLSTSLWLSLCMRLGHVLLAYKHTVVPESSLVEMCHDAEVRSPSWIQSWLA
jgi:hypothetical protein